jgi:hypothetical protein
MTDPPAKRTRTNPPIDFVKTTRESRRAGIIFFSFAFVAAWALPPRRSKGLTRGIPVRAPANSGVIQLCKLELRR